MKTAISIPDPLYKSAEDVARKLRVSRSKLYARALAEYLRRYDERQLDQEIAEFYDNHAPTIDPAGVAAQSQVLRKEDW